MIKYILIAVVLIIVVTLIFYFVKKAGTTDDQTNTTTPTNDGKIEISASGFTQWMSNLFGKDESTSPVMVTDEEIDELIG